MCENNFLIRTILLVGICTFLLALASIGYYYYFTKYRKKAKTFITCHDTSSKY